MHVENVIKVIITVFLIGLIVLFVVFFTILGLTPTERLGRAFEARNATSSEEGVPAAETQQPVAEESAMGGAESQVTQTTPSGTELVGGGVVYLDPSLVARQENAVRIVEGRMSETAFTAKLNEDKQLWFYSPDATYIVKIPAYGLSQTIRPGETKLIAFQATQAGTFDIVCEGCVEGFRASLTVR